MIIRKQPKVHVTLYTPAADEPENATRCLGVFKQKKKAYQKAIDELIDDIEKKYGDSDKKKKKAKEVIDEIEEEEDYLKKLEKASDAVIKAYGGKDDEAPYCEVAMCVYDAK